MSFLITLIKWRSTSPLFVVHPTSIYEILVQFSATLHQKRATLVYSLNSYQLDYCNSLLIELPEIQINHLQHIQNSAARIVSRRPHHEHITPVLENVQQWIMFKVALFVFKCLNGLAPPYLAEMITVKENFCNCELRSDGCLQEKKTNNSFGDRAFSICGPVLWNRLPKCMKEINSLDKFKKEL